MNNTQIDDNKLLGSSEKQALALHIVHLKVNNRGSQRNHPCFTNGKKFSFLYNFKLLLHTDFSKCFTIFFLSSRVLVKFCDSSYENEKLITGNFVTCS